MINDQWLIIKFSIEIILQIKVPVLSDDTPEILQKRVLEKEHILLIEGIKKLIEN